jgi:hypothetical protein
MSAVQVNTENQNIVERKQSGSDSSVNKTNTAEAEKGTPYEDVEETKVHSWTSYERLRPFILVGLALLIFGWWISSIVLPATRHRWFVSQISNVNPRFAFRSNPRPSPLSSRIVQTFWAWSFIL